MKTYICPACETKIVKLLEEGDCSYYANLLTDHVEDTAVFIDSTVANKAFIASTAVYLHPTLGWNHGLLRPIKGDNLVTKIGAGTGKVIIHGAGGALFYRLLRR